MKLTVCPSCHAQYDVEGVRTATFPCPCGAQVSSTPPPARDAEVRRCAACGALVEDAERRCSYCGADVVREPERSGPVCPECYARNPERARHCTACGIAFLPQPARTRTVALACPVCPDRPSLAARPVGGVWVDECPTCLGLWAPGDMMDRLVERVRERRGAGAPAPPAERERRAAWQERVAYRRCPECGATMLRRNFGRRSGVILDWCAGHGTWLDAHEMEDVAAFVLAGGLERGPARVGDRAGDWSMPADPGRLAAMVAAERILAEERARSSEAARGFDRDLERKLQKGWRSIGDLLSDLLKH